MKIYCVAEFSVGELQVQSYFIDKENAQKFFEQKKIDYIGEDEIMSNPEMNDDEKKKLLESFKKHAEEEVILYSIETKD